MNKVESKQMSDSLREFELVVEVVVKSHLPFIWEGRCAIQTTFTRNKSLVY